MMAGSFKHVLDDKGNYIGVDMLENMGDAEEAIEQMAFVLLSIRHRWGGDLVVEPLIERYYECLRGERPWPDFMKSGGRKA
jgi:hypothetical protein